MDLGGLVIAGGAFLAVAIHHSMTSAEGNDDEMKDVQPAECSPESLISIGKEFGITFKFDKTDIIFAVIDSPDAENDDSLLKLCCSRVLSNLKEQGISQVRPNECLPVGHLLVHIDFASSSKKELRDIVAKIKKSIDELRNDSELKTKSAAVTKHQRNDQTAVTSEASNLVNPSTKDANEIAASAVDDDIASVSSIGNATTSKTPRARRTSSALKGELTVEKASRKRNEEDSVNSSKRTRQN